MSTGVRRVKKSLTLIQRISEHGKAKVACPKCKSVKVKPQVSGFQVKTSRKS